MPELLVYWAPELFFSSAKIKNEQPYTQSIDLWALGITIY